MSSEEQPAYAKGERLWLLNDATGAFDTEVLVEGVAPASPSKRNSFFAALVSPAAGVKENQSGSVEVVPVGGGPAVWVSPGQIAARLRRQPQSPWDASSAYVLCPDGEEAQFAGKGRFIAKEVANSVRSAAQKLNDGTLQCSEGFCAVFSSDRATWYVLHRQDMRDSSLASFGVPAGRPNSPQGATPLGVLSRTAPMLQVPDVGHSFAPGDRIEMKSYDSEEWEAGGVVTDVVTGCPRQLGDIEMPVGSAMVAFQNGTALRWVWAQEVPTRLRKEGAGGTSSVIDVDDWAATNASGDAAEVFGFAAGDTAEVWSNTRGDWIPCGVQAVFLQEVEADGFTVPPNTIKVESEAGVKYIREDAILKELRRACPPVPASLGVSAPVSPQVQAFSPPGAASLPAANGNLPQAAAPPASPYPAPAAAPPAAAAPPVSPYPAPALAAAPAPAPAPASKPPVGSRGVEQAPPPERKFVKYSGRRPLQAGQRVHVYDAVKTDWETDAEVVNVLDAPLACGSFEVPAGSITVVIRNDSGVTRRTIQPDFLASMLRVLEDDPSETLEDERVASAWEVVFARFQAGGKLELAEQGALGSPAPARTGSDPKGQDGSPGKDNHDRTPKAARPPSRVPQKGVMLPDLHNVSILGDDFTPTASKAAAPEPPAYDRRQKKVLIIGVGFGLKVNERQFNMIRDAGFQTRVFHDVPNPELPNFNMAPHIYKLRDQIREYNPDLLAVASKGGAYLAVLWHLRYWTGPTLVLNRHPTLTALPRDANVVLAHGSNDEVYSQPRERLEAVIRTGDPNKCLLYYTNNSGLLGGKTLTREGDHHNMESLLLYECLPRLCDAALCGEGPEMQFMQSWMQMISDERSEAERWLGFTMSDLRRLWDRDSRGADEKVVFEVPKGCEEWDMVSVIFKAQPRVARAYHDMNPGMWQNIEILRIDRVENAFQDDGCEAYVRIMQRGLEQQGLTFRPGLHTRWAFHGSSAVEEIVRDPVASFQPLLGGSRASTVWGPGTYFARDAKYVYDGGFSRILPDGSKQILLCLLMTGMVCLGDPEHKGLLPTRSGRHRYNSSVDYLSNPEIFITQYPQAAYPAYVITFRS